VTGRGEGTTLLYHFGAGLPMFPERGPEHLATMLSMVTLTDTAAGKVKELLNGQAAEAESGLRVAVRGGGCSGFQYALAFDQQREGDQVFEYQEIRLLIDSQSLPFVDGSEVDYVEGLQGAGFSVNNPNVVAACGCGQSFRTAE
jgi:iron-sulfur cluster assembly protein